MTVVRPSNQVQQEQGPALEVNVELQILAKLEGLSGQVTGIGHRQNILLVKLFGAEDGDTEHGRLPVVERAVTGHETRIDALEKQVIRWKAYAAAAAGIGGVTGAIMSWILHGVGALFGHH